jgi:hypothetical protein
MFGTESKELVLSLAGKAVCEISEMGMRGSTNANHVKAMISRQVDAGRTAYARSVTERSRRNIWIGTTNSDTSLEDPSGNRRFLPVEVATPIDVAWLSRNVHQLVGEAATLEARGVDFNLPPEIWGDAAARQEAVRVESAAEVYARSWFDNDMQDLFITLSDLRDAFTMAKAGSLASVPEVMAKLGFIKRQDRHPCMEGRKDRAWVKTAPGTLPAAWTRMVPSQPINGGRVTMRTEPPISAAPPTYPPQPGAAPSMH